MTNYAIVFMKIFIGWQNNVLFLKVSDKMNIDRWEVFT